MVSGEFLGDSSNVDVCSYRFVYQPSCHTDAVRRTARRFLASTVASSLRTPTKPGIPGTQFCVPVVRDAAFEAQYVEVPPMLGAEFSFLHAMKKMQAWKCNDGRFSSRADQEYSIR